MSATECKEKCEKAQKWLESFDWNDHDAWEDENLAIICAALQALPEILKYKDLEERGLLQQLPCKIGDELFYIGSECDEDECEDYDDYCYRSCVKCVTPKVKSFVVKQFKIKKGSIAMINCDEIFYADEIGTKVFFTKEEAEEAKMMIDGKLIGG